MRSVTLWWVSSQTSWTVRETWMSRSACWEVSGEFGWLADHCLEIPLKLLFFRIIMLLTKSFVGLEWFSMAWRLFEYLYIGSESVALLLGLSFQDVDMRGVRRQTMRSLVTLLKPKGVFFLWTLQEFLMLLWKSTKRVSVRN